MQGRKQQLEVDMEQQTGSKLGKEYVKAVYCHPAFFLNFYFFISWMGNTCKSMADSFQYMTKPTTIL